VRHIPGETEEANPSLSEGALLVRAEHPDPFGALGPHEIERDGARRVVIRVIHPYATDIWVLFDGQTFPAARIEPEGLFETVLPAGVSLPLGPERYRLRIRWHDGGTSEIADTYAFPPVLTEFDLHLFGEGTHQGLYEKMGAHVREIAGVLGVHFCVWAPNAMRVSVVGDFNHWDGRMDPMRARGESGIWELFVPGLEEGSNYKFEIRSKLGALPFLKADPFAFQAELRPKTASKVRNIDNYSWQDSAWMHARRHRDWLSAPISVYEVHLGSWRRLAEDGNRWLTYRELAQHLIAYVKQMGYTHIELLPVMEHPYDASWGYQTVGYFAATSRYGSPDELMHFIDLCHLEGIGVILDWTPAHFPADAHGLGEFDGTHLYEHSDPRQGHHPDWGTLVFNYGRTEVRNFLMANALFWFDKYHVDGLRVDAVASMLYLDYSRKEGEWIPNQFGGRENLDAIAFLKRLNEVVYATYPGVLMIAEESTAWPAVSRPTYDGGLGFNLKWNMGWMNDTLSYFSKDPVYRRYEHNRMTFSMLYAFTENFVLPLSHDEVVHGKASLMNKMPGDLWQQFANLRLLYSYFYAHPGKKMLFMGGEFGQRSEWDSSTSLEWPLLAFPEHQGMQRLVSDLNTIYQRERSLHEVDFDWHGFEWIDCDDAAASILTFIRRAKAAEDFIVAIANFTPVPQERYRVGVPEAGYYREFFNSDGAAYGGTDWGNGGGAMAEAVSWNQRPYSLQVRVPPLGVLYLKPQRS
jgi:1,4-alpha-glucan branching enzyme